MRKITILLATTALAAAIGYESKAGWKKGTDGSLETDSDGNPIMLDGDGKETTIAPGYINRLNTESATHRASARDAQRKLEAFGDLDPVAAKEAVAKVRDVDFSKMIDKGELEAVKRQMSDQYEKDIKDRDDRLAQTNARLDNVTLSNALTTSKFLNDRLALPSDAAIAMYRDKFKVEDGKVIPLNERGEPLINKHGDIANVDEAMEAYITARPDKDTWLKAPEAGGSGSGGGGGGRGGANVIKRSDYDTLPPMKQAEIGSKMARGEMTIVD